MSKSAIVIGAGIAGLAVSRALAIKGYHVTVFERNEKAVGASIRNFGMVWPLGQPSGKLLERAMHSRSIWKQICNEGNIWFNESGSMLNVYYDDELAVIEEFVAASHRHRDCAVLTPAQTTEKSPATNPEGLKASLWSSAEMIIDPREAIAKLPVYLAYKYGVKFHFNKAISHIENGKAYSGKEVHEADVILVCSGADFETLYPDVFADSGLTKCKLQMMRTIPQDEGWRTGPALSSGLTLTHYDSFAACPSMKKLKARFEEEMPEYVKWGIHVMISQNGLGEINIGDSHEYGLVHDPFDSDNINQLIMYYLHKFTRIQNLEISHTWHGIYPKLKGKTEFVTSPESGVIIMNGLGGGGMTLSFGLAEEVVGGL